MRLLSGLYLLASALLVAALYLGWPVAQPNGRDLVLEAVFAWLAVFVPPLVIVERSVALARRLLALRTVPVPRRPGAGG